MSEKTYQNIITPTEVSIALGHLMFAPEGTAYDGTRIDVSSPPAGFFPLGAVQDDAAQIRVVRTPYDLKTGLPRVLAYRAIVDLMGELSFVFHSYTNQKAFMGLGGYVPLHVRLAAHSAAPPVVTSYTASRTVVSVNTMTGFTVGMMVVTAANADIPTTYNYSHVVSINASSNILYLDRSGFAVTPIVGQQLVGIERDDLALGTSVSPFFHLVGVADFLNGAQVVYDFPKAGPRGDWADQARAVQDYRTPAVFDVYGVPATVQTVPEMILGYRHTFHGNRIA